VTDAADFLQARGERWGHRSNQLPRMGGSWVSAFFGWAVGPVQELDPSRLRVFLLASLALLTLVQALGRTHLTTASPEVNTENILAILAPLVSCSASACTSFCWIK
jgi:hypothetical protein